MTNFIGIDVGSYKVRAALYTLSDNQFKLIQKEEVDITVFNHEMDFYEQSSEEIWNKIVEIIKKIMKENTIDSKTIGGIGFDATCSLVILNKEYRPMSVSLTGDNNRNIIMWMDIRSKIETGIINNSKHHLLKYTGGKISVEMQPPKLMWLNKNIPNFQNQLGLAMDLCDYLTFRSTQSTVRSLCSVTCKWAYDGLNKCWNDEFWKMCELEKLCENNYKIIGQPEEIQNPGTKIKNGLCACASKELGLLEGTPVFVGVIDAYAGLLGGLQLSQINNFQSNQPISFSISGSSACHLIMTENSVFVPGVWGPYKDVLFSKHFVLESGQTLNGLLLDHFLKIFNDFDHLITHDNVISMLQNLCQLPSNNTSESEIWIQINKLTKDIHINPDFQGNRSPRSNENIRGSIIGLSVGTSRSKSAMLYLAAVQAIVYEYKEILEQFNKYGINPGSIVLAGGMCKNNIYTQVLSDVTGLPVIMYPETDLVLLGAASLCVMQHDIKLKFNEANHVLNPTMELKEFHQRKYQIYKELVEFQTRILN